MEAVKTHIVILTGQHMVANPRVWKEANSLASQGYKVTILTTWYDASLREADKALLHPLIQYKAAVNLLRGESSFMEWGMSRIDRKWANLKKRYTGRDSLQLLCYSPALQLQRALQENADLYIVHQETGLLLGRELIKMGKNVAVDIEDWYSHDYINSMRPVQLLQEAEKFVLQKAVYSTCPSIAMRKALSSFYALDQQPEVIYNGFSCKENEQLTMVQRRPNSFVWFSQVIGPHRGLETLMEGLNHLTTPVELHLLGRLVPGYDKQLRSLISDRHQLFFYPPVPHPALLPFLAQFRIGLATENPYPENKNTTVSNKILQYVQAGCCVLATGTKGQEEVASEFPDSISIVQAKEPHQWANAMHLLLQKPENSLQQQASVFAAKFSWEAQEQILLKLVKTAVDVD